MTDRQARPKVLPEISALVPVLGAAGTLEAAVTRLHEALEQVARRFEVIVILEPGSKGAHRVVKTLGERLPGVRGVTLPAGQAALGDALRAGLREARYKYILCADAQNRYDPQQVDKMARLIEGSDLVVGFRTDESEPLVHRAAAWVYNRILDLVLKTRVRDPACTFKLARRGVFDDIRLSASGDLVAPEIISRARRVGRHITEVEVKHDPRDSGQISPGPRAVFGLPPVGQIMQVLGELWQLRKRIQADAEISGDSMHKL